MKKVLPFLDPRRFGGADGREGDNPLPKDICLSRSAGGDVTAYVYGQITHTYTVILMYSGSAHLPVLIQQLHQSGEFEHPEEIIQ